MTEEQIDERNIRDAENGLPIPFRAIIQNEDNDLDRIYYADTSAPPGGSTLKPPSVGTPLFNLDDQQLKRRRDILRKLLDVPSEPEEQ
ncbi:hypothetical protein [Streptomyces sp. NPDC096033]|uniref:hypothetical protein n=1 Tax=Streptomyces sp. NPDC096033 TaxID=3366071 RepID=UPI003825C7F7